MISNAISRFVHSTRLSIHSTHAKSRTSLQFLTSIFSKSTSRRIFSTMFAGNILLSTLYVEIGMFTILNGIDGCTEIKQC